MKIAELFLIIHIASGSTALITGGIAALAQKGKKRHITLGRIFATAMIVAAISALILSNIRPNPFLFGIGIFTLYLVVSGWVPAWRIPLHKKNKLMKAIGVFGLLSAVYMIIYALYSGSTGVVVIYAVFGTILLIFAITDTFRPITGPTMIRRHGGRIGGAYIAAFTAFLVVNINFLPPLIVWLMPTVIGAPMIRVALKKWARRVP